MKATRRARRTQRTAVIPPSDPPIPQASANQADGYILKEEVAVRLCKKPRTVERWMRLGIIPHIKIGKGRGASVLFHWPTIQQHLATRFAVGGLN